MDRLRLWGCGFLDIQNEINKLNFEHRIKSMETILYIWKSRCLILKGKITIIKTL